VIDDSNLKDTGTGGTHDFTNEATMEEKHRVLGNDAKLRAGDREPTTFYQLANVEDELGQRPSPLPQYPKGPSWCTDPVPPEPPLGFRVDELPDMTTEHGVNVAGNPEWVYGKRLAQDDVEYPLTANQFANGNTGDE